MGEQQLKRTQKIRGAPVEHPLFHSKTYRFFAAFFFALLAAFFAMYRLLRLLWLNL
jgi:hypothetical protein